ncbi:MAG TPA: DUF4397 domain-containing protein [Desulfobacterales bacterium]|nr:DUF4397 domain-containing protein [Desulfobacterales bacterium]
MKKLIVILVALLVVWWPWPQAGAQEEEALLTLIHASPDAGEVDAFVDGKLAFTGIPYGGGQMQSFAAKGHVVKIVLTGEGIEKALATTPVSLQAGQSYTLIAYSDARRRMITEFVADDLTPPPPGKFRVRAFQLSPDIGRADIVLKGGPTLLSGANFKEFTPRYLEVDKSAYDLEVFASGEPKPAVAISDFKFEAGKIYTIILTGRKADAGTETGLRPIIASAAISPLIESIVPPTATLTPTRTPTLSPTPTSTPSPTPTPPPLPTPLELPITGGSGPVE